MLSLYLLLKELKDYGLWLKPVSEVGRVCATLLSCCIVFLTYSIPAFPNYHTALPVNCVPNLQSAVVSQSLPIMSVVYLSPHPLWYLLFQLSVIASSLLHHTKFCQNTSLLTHGTPCYSSPSSYAHINNHSTLLGIMHLF